jgi:hypothetical protein
MHYACMVSTGNTAEYGIVHVSIYTDTLVQREEPRRLPNMKFEGALGFTELEYF